MKRSLLALAVMATALSAQANVINNLTISALPNPVPQSLSHPCIVCGTTAPAQPADFGYNDFSNRGSDTSFNTFSTNLLGGGPLPGDLEANALPYSGQLLEAFLNAGNDNPKFTFGVAIDINTSHGGETLTAFQLIDLSKPAGDRIIFDFTGSLALPDIHNGNGKGDYLISGFNLFDAGVQPGDNLIFHAAWEGASDGAESFYLVVIPSAITETPEPASAALFGLGLIGMTGMGAIRRRRANGSDAMRFAAA